MGFEEGILTRAYAETVGLPRNPFSRNRTIRRFLQDPEVIGSSASVMQDRTGLLLVSEADGELVLLETSRLLGRDALIAVSNIIDHFKTRPN